MLDKIKKFIGAKLRIPKNYGLIAYKLLNDLLLIMLVFFAGILVAEGLLPGIIADRFGLYKIVWPILLDIIAITIIAKIYDIQVQNLVHKKTTLIVVLFIALLIANSLVRLNIFLWLAVFAIIIATGYFIYQLFFRDKQD